MSGPQKQHRFEITFEATGRAVGKMRNEISVGFVGREEGPWDMATDEGGFHGGDGTAPPPLAYFATGFTGCIMTQLRAFAKRLDIEIKDLTVTGRFAWEANQTGRDPYVSGPVGFGFDIEIDSDASPDDLKRLVEAAKKGCFIDQSLAVANNVGHRLRIGGDWVDLGPRIVEGGYNGALSDGFGSSLSGRARTRWARWTWSDST